ncbi:hypothetical protein [Levilactobacillus enshiensis]|uniref:hypothetical protein n=1 Tax=Levilactobacillus enshiensis TaxID=2590213 RepID=UPI00131E409D|nr:hypothetical protein [Levilactobacillus enshiensis]
MPFVMTGSLSDFMKYLKNGFRWDSFQALLKSSTRFSWIAVSMPYGHEMDAGLPGLAG